MALYKRVSTLLTIACVLYMCMVSLFHNGLQVSNLQERTNDDFTQNPDEHPDLLEDISNWTTREHHHKVNQSDLQNIHLPNNLPYSHSDEYSEQNLTPRLTRTSLTMKRSNITSLRKELKEHQFISQTKLRARTIQKTKVSFKEQTTFGDKSILPEPTTSKVTQYKVDFIPLGDLFVYGTFLDTRYSDSQYARVFVLQPGFKRDRQLMCRFYNIHNTSITVQAERYEMCENHGRKYGGWIYSCKVPNTEDVDLHTVSLLLFAENGKVFHSLTSVQLQSLSPARAPEPRHKLDDQFVGANNVQNRLQKQLKFGTENETQTNTRMKLGVCVPPLYGNHCLSKVVNFIEMCRLLGADTVFLYIHDIPNDTLSFLQNYTSQAADILTLVTWELPVVHKTTSASELNQIIWNHGQLLTIQHCLYANMANFDWLLFLDIDEILIPKISGTWQAMLSLVEARLHSQLPLKPLAGISFQSAFFQQDFQTQVTNSIDYFQYLHRTKQTSSQRFKLFVQPLWVFELGIHHVSKAISEDTRVVTAGLGEGLIHHYRKCVSDDEPASDLQCEILVKDETILKYEAPLTIASREVLSGAMEFFIHGT